MCKFVTKFYDTGKGHANLSQKIITISQPPLLFIIFFCDNPHPTIILFYYNS